MRKLKLENRISMGYIFLFLILILFLNTSLVYVLKSENKKTLIKMISNKSNEINDFLNKVTVFSERYDNFSLEFHPKIEGKKVTYSKPFNPGEEDYNYLLILKESRKVKRVYLNTFEAMDIDIEINEDKLVNLLENLKINENEFKEGKVISFYDNKRESKKYYVFKLMREIKGNEFIIYVLKDITINENIINRIIILSLLLTVVGVFVIIIISNYLSKKILKPVNTIIKIANDVTVDDLSKRVPEFSTGDELEKLTKIINRMLERLEISFYNQSKFVSDASHELRTPLAIIKGYAEIIKKRKMTNVEIFEESVDSIINESDNMKNLVEKLLFLARDEKSILYSEFSEINISELINQIYSDMSISIKTHEFVIEKLEEFYIKGDETLLKQSIRAIIENSIKYSKKGSKIYIKTEIKSDKGVISIRDEGVGISEFDLKRIFERFYRVDESRTKYTGGTGLGLAITKRIIDLHNGKIEVKSKENIGTEMIITLSLVE